MRLACWELLPGELGWPLGLDPRARHLPPRKDSSNEERTERWGWCAEHKLGVP